jgi:signal transduction histidine kinase
MGRWNVLVQSRPTWPLDQKELQPALHLVVALARADMGILMLHDEASDKLIPVVGHGLSAAQCALFEAHKPTDGPFAAAMAQHRRVRLRNAWNDSTTFRDVARAVGFRHVEVLPFFRPDGTVLGAFAIIYRTRHGSRRSAVRLESYCADVMAVTLSHAHARLQAEEARKRTAIDAQSKVNFFARLSHELRTPLQSILGYVDLLRTGVSGPVGESQVKMLARISEGARLIVRIVDDLLTFSRLEAGHEVFRVSAVPAARSMRAVEAIVSPLAEERGISLKVETPSNDVLVKADEDKLKQILLNLSANAVKHTSSGGQVRLSCSPNGESIRFDVEDDGTGIPLDKLGEIFGPYVQLAASPTHGFGGSGLGLAISREYAAGMDGSLSVSSEVGRGSVFSLTLPVGARERKRPALSSQQGQAAVS